MQGGVPKQDDRYLRCYGIGLDDQQGKHFRIIHRHIMHARHCFIGLFRQNGVDEITFFVILVFNVVFADLFHSNMTHPVFRIADCIDCQINRIAID